MANVKNLKIQTSKGLEFSVPRSCFYNGFKVKEIYFNNLDYTHENATLIWKNSDLFRFVQGTITGSFDPNTIVFQNFGNTFNGEYKTVESESEIDPTDEGQMYVQEVTDNE